MVFKKCFLGMLCSVTMFLGTLCYAQRQANDHCPLCVGIFTSVQAITRGFPAHDNNEYFYLMQNQLGETLQCPCSCCLLTTLKNNLQMLLHEQWPHVSPELIQEMRENNQLFYVRE